MRIIIVHYRYSMKGGPERYLVNISKNLKRQGHEVFEYSINWNDNAHNQYSDYWPSIKFSNGEFHYNNIENLSIYKLLRLSISSIYNKSIYNNFLYFIKEKKPDIIYLLTFLGKLTPAVLKASKKAQIPIVHRISDYSLICLNSIQHDGEKICEECNKSFLNGIRKKCFRSYLNSSIQYLIRKFLYLSNLHKNINCFVSPSQNTIELLKKNNYYKNANFAYLPTFSNINFNLSSEILENRFKNKKFVYWGRISPEKDFSLLLKAFKELNCTGYNLKLDIVGFDESAFSKQLITQIKNENLEDVITTHNFMSDSTMAKIREEAFVYLFPSKIYDNLPQSVIESLSLGIPVIASDLGSLKELIIDKYNGFLYLPNSVDSLFNAIIKSTESFDLYKKMAENALKHVQNKYSEKLHLTRLMEVFQENIKTQ